MFPPLHLFYGVTPDLHSVVIKWVIKLPIILPGSIRNKLQDVLCTGLPVYW